MLGPGGQIESFDAVFSPADIGRAGRPVPRPLFDRRTGAIDPAVAEAWEPYDIRLKLQDEWATNRASLVGKIHVYGGGKDTFYLGESVGLLADSLAEMGVELGSTDEPGVYPEADVRIIGGMPHTFYPPGIRSMWRAIGERWAEREE